MSLQGASIIALIVMIAGFIGLKVISNKQQTLKNANLYAILDLVVIFVCAGTLIWNEFLYDLVVDKASLAKDRQINSFKIQGYGVADYINSKGISKDGILLITTAAISDEELESFQKGMAAGGISGPFEVTKIGKEVAMPGPGIGPAGGPVMVTFTDKDIKNAMKGKKGGVVIHLAGMPSNMAMSQITRAAKAFDLNKDCSVIFAGQGSFPSPALGGMVSCEFIDAAVYAVEIADARESMSGDPKSEFAKFFAIADKQNPMVDKLSDK